jgi:flagellar assembly protein FliH
VIEVTAQTVTPGPSAEALAEAVQHEIANGYAKGFEQGLAEGREKGYADGFAAGSRVAHERSQQDAHRLRSIIDRLSAPIPALERVIEEALVSLALEIARCVIGSEVKQSRDYLIRLLREALSKVPVPRSRLQIALNPDDLEHVRALAPDIEAGGASLVADLAIETGGCLIVIDGERPSQDRRWRPRGGESMSQIDLSLAARWRSVMLLLFDGEER